MGFDRTPIQERAHGRWRGVLAALGVEQKYLTGKHGPCPICRDGDDRFRFDDKQGNGTYFCSKCGAGNGVGFVMALFQCQFIEAVKMIEPHIGGAEIVVKAGRRSDADKREAMASVWARARPLDGEDLASRYLKSRNIDLPIYPAALRFLSDMPFYPDGGGMRLLPCMLAKFAAADGKSAILHRSFLEEPGRRATGIKKGVLMPGVVPPGGAVRMGEASETMGVAEGLETAMAASILHNLPVWACLSTTGLMKWEPPDLCRHVLIFGDVDPKFGGQMAAYALAHKLAARRGFVVDTRFPDPDYAPVDANKVDWADVLQSRVGENSDTRRNLSTECSSGAPA